MTRRLWALAGASVLVRAAGSLTLAVVAPDGARNLRMARLMLDGDWTGALTLYPVTHPLYPVLIAGGQTLAGGPLLAACAISVLLGGLAVVPLYHLARSVWNERVATIAAILYAFLPAAVELQCDAMLEGPFPFFFLAGMALAASALDRRSWERAVLAGVCAACAWLTRPEGAYLLPLFLLALLLRPSRFALVALPAIVLPALVIATPYQGFIREQTGRYGLSASPFSAGILGLFTGESKASGYQVDDKTRAEFEEYEDIHRYGRFGGPAVTLVKNVSKVLFHVLVPFVLIGFWKLRTQDFRGPPGIYLLAAAGGYFLPVILAFAAGTPFSHRYILVPCLLLLPVAAVGLLQAAAWARHPRALPLFLLALCLGMLLRDVRPKRDEKVGVKLAGRAILGKLGPGQKILAMSRQVEYYADGVFVEFLPRSTFEEVRKQVVDSGIDAIALWTKDFRNVGPGMEEAFDRTYTPLGSYSKEGDDRPPMRVWLTTPRSP